MKGAASSFSLPVCWRPVGGASRPCLRMIMRGGVDAWTLSPRLEQIRKEKEKTYLRVKLPQYSFFLLAGLLYNRKKIAESPEYFFIFLRKSIFFFLFRYWVMALVVFFPFLCFLVWWLNEFRMTKMLFSFFLSGERSVCWCREETGPIFPSFGGKHARSSWRVSGASVVWNREMAKRELCLTRERILKCTWWPSSPPG